MARQPSEAAKRRAKQRVHDCVDRLMIWHGKYPHESETNPDFKAALKARDMACVNAIRLGLRGDPDIGDLIEEWIVTHRGFGNRDKLRDADKQPGAGVAKGVKNPWTQDDWALREEIQELAVQYKSQAKVRKFLVARGTIPKMTPQNFHKILKRLDLLHYFSG